MKTQTVEIRATEKQKQFIEATAFEVLFGGAAGGGKSFGQLVDALQYSLSNPRSKQLILRRTYPELEKSLIRVAMELYPRSVFKYNSASHTGVFTNGSIIDFGYCDRESDVYRYQSAEYDVIRFDELTHFTEHMYEYLISRCRGANGYKKQIKSSTNPGGVGHTWVKERFVDIGPAGIAHQIGSTDRIFIPSLIQDNPALMESDPEYLLRLEKLTGDEKKALLYGDWDLFDGQYFAEFDRRVHTTRPFDIPEHWRRYRALDYGLDMLACYWIAVSDGGRAYIYRELYEPGHIVSAAAKRIREETPEREKIYASYAGPDLWNRNRDTGRSTAEIFYAAGVPLSMADNDRRQGWLDLKEWLAVREDEQGARIADLCIFDTCINLIRTLPALQYDPHDPTDTANEPHELTHAPDAIRYFVAGRPAPGRKPAEKKRYNFASERPRKAPGGKGEGIKRI